MNTTLAKAIVALAPAGMLLCGSVALFVQTRAAACLFQLIGAGGLLVVVLAHVCEAVSLFPWMGWGQERSLGHYLDLGGAILGIVLFPAGFLLHALTTRSAHERTSSELRR